MARSKEVEEGVVIDFDEGGHIVGIEVLDARERFGLKDLVNVRPANPAWGGPWGNLQGRRWRPPQA